MQKTVSQKWLSFKKKSDLKDSFTSDAKLFPVLDIV